MIIVSNERKVEPEILGYNITINIHSTGGGFLEINFTEELDIQARDTFMVEVIDNNTLTFGEFIYKEEWDESNEEIIIAVVTLFQESNKTANYTIDIIYK